MMIFELLIRNFLILKKEKKNSIYRGKGDCKPVVRNSARKSPTFGAIVNVNPTEV